MRRHLAPLVAALAVLVPVAGCGDDDTAVEDTTTTAPAEDPIAGRTFEAVVLEGGTHALVDGTTLTIEFATDDGIIVEAGCNRLSGTYAVDGPILVVRDLSGTEMACEAALMEQDAWISALLVERPVITPMAPDGLSLTRDEEVLTMVEAGSDETAAEVVGPAWALDTLIDGESAGSVPAGVTATITFAADGTYQVAAGCNTGSGTYAEAGAGTFRVDAPGLTRRRCDEEAMGVEAAVLAVLAGEVTATIEGEQLTLLGPDGTGLGFRAG